MGGKNWPVSRLLRHSPSPGDTSTFFSSSSVPRTVNPGGIRSSWQPSSLLLGRICPRIQSYVVLPQAWVSPYQCLHMLPPFGQDVASIAPFSGRLAFLPLLPSCNNKEERLEAVFHWRSKSLLITVGKGTAAWLSPAAIYSVAFVCHALACQHLHATRLWRGSRLVALSIGPLCQSRHNS